MLVRACELPLNRGDRFRRASSTAANQTTPAVIETLTQGVEDRGDFDVAADSGYNLDGQYYGFSSGTGCQFQAAAAIGSPASGVATGSTTAGTHQQTLLGARGLR